MKTRIVENWQGDTIDVYVFFPPDLRENVTGPARLFRPDPEDGQRLKLTDVTQEALETELMTGGGFSAPAPTYRIPTSVVDDLIAAYRKMRPSASTDDAITDARATRDVLLGIVERAMTSYTTAP